MFSVESEQPANNGIVVVRKGCCRDGSDWTESPSPGPYNVTSIDMLSPAAGWATAVGDGGPYYYSVILRWNGTSWFIDYRLTNSEWIRSVSMLSATDGWAVGDSIWHWDGIAWDQARPGWNYWLLSVDALSPDDV